LTVDQVSQLVTLLSFLNIRKSFAGQALLLHHEHRELN